MARSLESMRTVMVEEFVVITQEEKNLVEQHIMLRQKQGWVLEERSERTIIDHIDLRIELIFKKNIVCQN